MAHTNAADPMTKVSSSWLENGKEEHAQQRQTHIEGQHRMMQNLVYGQARVPKRDAFDGQRPHVHSTILCHHDLYCPIGFHFCMP